MPISLPERIALDDAIARLKRADYAERLDPRVHPMMPSEAARLIRSLRREVDDLRACVLLLIGEGRP